MKKSIILIALALMLQLGCKTQQPFFPVATVESFLNEMVDFMEANHINRANIDWVAFRESVQLDGKNAETIADTDTSILLALELLNDNSSFVIKSNGEVLTFSVPCTDVKPPALTTSPDIGYIKIPPYSNVGVSAAIFAEKMHGDIRDQDKSDLKGWIIDLRENTGGNLWPMIAGIGPILGNGTAGFFVDSNGEKKPFGYNTGSSTFNEGNVVTVSFPYTLVSPDSKVAVLMDKSTTNAGEVVAIAFSGKANTKSFGTLTCGKAGGNQSFFMSNGAALYITTAFLHDRNDVNKQGVLTPDVVLDNAVIFDKAVEWINE